MDVLIGVASTAIVGQLVASVTHGRRFERFTQSLNLGYAAGVAKGEQTRRAILDAAIDRFGRDGYRATSVADIARDAGVSGTAAYAYFPNKEALFLAALDDDAAAVIDEGVSQVLDDPTIGAEPADDWGQHLFFTLLGAVDHHPLARRILAGLEPGVTDRVVEIPALSELRKACAERLRAEQVAGTVRPDIDPVAIASGVVAIISSLLMSVVQLGGKSAAVYAKDVTAVLAAALDPPATY
jgi:AcrR family transcriptional regulator